jgi:CMP-N-acetylneuraminic acid synthetase
MRILTIIPARAGSKGLSGKNIKQLAGKPLITWTLEATRAAGLNPNDVIVSTDSEQIAEVVRAAGGNCPFLRPAEFATDEASSLVVMQHALAFAERSSGQYDWLLLLQPTSPLRTGDDIKRVIHIAQSNHLADSVVSVSEEPSYHPHFAKYVDPSGCLKSFGADSLESTRRQDCYPSAVFNNGAIYLTRRDILQRGMILGGYSIAYIMPKERSIDIDDELDFVVAQAMIERREYMA